MQITVTFVDSDLTDPIIRSQLMHWLGVAQAGGVAAVAHTGNGEDRQPAPLMPPTTEASPPAAAPTPAPVRATRKGRPTNEERAAKAAAAAASAVTTAQASAAPTPFPPGVTTQAANAAMPPVTAPTGETLTELQEWARRLDSKRPGTSFQILSDADYLATAAVPPERVSEFVTRFKAAYDRL